VLKSANADIIFVITASYLLPYKVRDIVDWLSRYGTGLQQQHHSCYVSSAMV